MTEWLSQNGEDRIVAEWLARHHPTLVGRVLDIGAHDGWSLSNTARLLERGWGGTLIEASPRPLAKLIDRWGDREDVDVIGACVVTARQAWRSRAGIHGVTRWHDDAGAACHGGESFLGTTEEANVAKWAPHTKFRRAFLASIAARDIAAGAWPRRWDVWSIDVEGTSVEILQEMSTVLAGLHGVETRDQFPLVVIVEHDNLLPDVYGWASTYGYRVLEANAENVIAVRE